LPDIKDTVGKNTMMKLSRPRKPTKNNPSEWHDDPADYETLYQYCAQDVRVEAKIDKQIRNLTAHEQSVWELDFRMNLRGLRVDIDAIETALAVHSKFQEERLRRFSAIVGGAFTPTQRSLVQKWLNSVLDLDEPISDTQAGTLESLLDIATGETKEAIEIFLSSTKASLAKLTSMLNYSDSEGRCRGQFQYHAASTGRWGGRGIQPQNLVRGNADYPPSVYFNYLLGEML
jgi:DNA polymerase